MGRRLLMIAYYFPPIKSIGALRNYHVATHLLPFFEKIRVFSTENARILDTENLPISENITVELLPTFDYRTLFSRRKRDKTGGTMHFKEEQKRGIVQWLIKLKFSFPFNFFLDEGAFRYIIAGVRRANRLVQAGEVTHLYSSFMPYADHLVAYFVKRRHPSVFWIADFRDLHVEPLYRNVVFEAFQHWCNRRILRRADLVLTVSEGLAAHLRRYHSDVYVLRNGIAALKNEAVDAPISPPTKFTIGYTGSMFQDERNPRLLLEVIRKLADEGILTPDNFQIRYAGKDASVWQSWVSKFNLADFFTSDGMISLHEARQIQASSHINLLLTSALPNYGGVMTGKFYEYLAAQNPILVLINGAQDIEFESFMNDFSAGCVAYNDCSFSEIKHFVLKNFHHWQQTGSIERTIKTEKLGELSWDFTIQKLMEKLSDTEGAVFKLRIKN